MCRAPCFLLGHRAKEINGFCFAIKEIVIVIVSHLMRLGVEALISGD